MGNDDEKATQNPIVVMVGEDHARKIVGAVGQKGMGMIKRGAGLLRRFANDSKHGGEFIVKADGEFAQFVVIEAV